MFLETVLKEKKAKVKEWKTSVSVSELKESMQDVEKRPFYNVFAERCANAVKIIAEVKKASPSMGILKEDFNLEQLVSAYNEGGAAAISVITEEKFFSGNIQLLKEVKKLTSLPILRKDFIVDDYEIYQAKAFGADSILLIAEALEKSQLYDFTALAKEIDLDVLIELHSLKSYEDKLLDIKDFLLGINNRDLYSLKVDLSTSEEILKHIPEDQKVVIESGIKDRKDIERFIQLGVSNFLIGTNLVLSENPAMMLKMLNGLNQ